MNTPLNFLFSHANKFYTPTQWATLLDVQIIDRDGWRDKGCDFYAGCDIVEFIERLAKSTIKMGVE